MDQSDYSSLFCTRTKINYILERKGSKLHKPCQIRSNRCAHSEGETDIAVIYSIREGKIGGRNSRARSGM